MSNYANLVDLAATIEGNHVYLNFEFTTGDASGQNMVTICTAEICKFIIDSSPVKPTAHYIESNLSGDKKASTQAFTTVRGKKVCAEAKIPAKLIKKILGTSPDKMVKYWKMSALWKRSLQQWLHRYLSHVHTARIHGINEGTQLS